MRRAPKIRIVGSWKTEAASSAIALQQLTELLNGKAGIASDTAHGEGVHRIVARNDNDALTVAHDDVLALTHDPETGFFQRADGVEVIDAGNLWQG
jgi:hypothetical protein